MYSDLQYNKEHQKGYRHPFVDGTRYLGGVGDLPRTLTELAMVQLSADIRRQPDWREKRTSNAFRSVWMSDGVSNIRSVGTASGPVNVALTEQQARYVLDELAGYDALFDEAHHCQVSCFERIWQLDSALGASEEQQLDNFLAAQRRSSTEAEPAVLLDPSCHCLVYEKTLVYDANAPDLLGPMPGPTPLPTESVSNKFAWIPTDFSVSTSGSATAVSYINDIDPRRRDVYTLMDSLVTSFLPLLEHVLTDLHRNNPLYQRIPGGCRYTEWDEPEPPEFSDDDEGWSIYERELAQWVMQRPIQFPDVSAAGYTGGLEGRKHFVSLKGRTVQIIAHVFEHRLPSNAGPHPGTAYAVVGSQNERIVACVLYYAAAENIKGSRIEFRMAVTSPRGFYAGDSGACFRTWGLENGVAQRQDIGFVEACRGRAVAFPNIYQHRHSSFDLVDPTKSGHQTIVALYLVDPDIPPIPSTTVIPPQQKQWIVDALEDSVDERFPTELITRIVDCVESILEPEEVEAIRGETEEERVAMAVQNNECHFSVPFDIWNETLGPG